MAKTMARNYVRENYPTIYAQERLIDEMCDLRDGNSELSRISGIWNPWEAIVDDLNSVASSDETNQELLSLLIDYKQSPSRDKLASLLKNELVTTHISQWANLYIYLSYVLLSDVESLPLLLMSNHIAMKELVNKNADALRSYFSILVENSFYSDDTIFIKGLPFVWSRKELLEAINNYESATVINDILHIEYYRIKLFCGNEAEFVNPYIDMMLFDRDYRPPELIHRLIERQDVDRLIVWVKSQPIGHFDDPYSIYRKIINSGLVWGSSLHKVIETVIERHGADQHFQRRMLRMIEGDEINTVTVKLLAAYYGDSVFYDRLKTNNLCNRVLQLLISHEELYILKVWMEKRLIDSPADESKITAFELALSLGAVKVLELLLPYYKIEPVLLLSHFTSKHYSSYESDRTKSLVWLFDKYRYTDEELLSAMMGCHSIAMVRLMGERMNLFKQRAVNGQGEHRVIELKKE